MHTKRPVAASNANMDEFSLGFSARSIGCCPENPKWIDGIRKIDKLPEWHRVDDHRLRYRDALGDVQLLACMSFDSRIKGASIFVSGQGGAEPVKLRIIRASYLMDISFCLSFLQPTFFGHLVDIINSFGL